MSSVSQLGEEKLFNHFRATEKDETEVNIPGIVKVYYLNNIFSS
jgi:hypothetical protein